jgi:hypothetical protein
MWGTYEYRGHRVAVIQQWRDPFGRRMVRVQLVDAEEQAAGLLEEEFLREAVAVGTVDAAP